jgi:NhaA family Na+:H+ antiporter
LAFENATVINNAKFMILTASLVAGMVGYFYLKFIRKVEVIEVE